MGHAHIDTLSTLTLSPVEERVAGKDKSDQERSEINEQLATGKNEQGNQGTNVCDDVTQDLKTDEWTVVKGQTRTWEKRSLATTNRSAKRKSERKAHSFV